MRDLSIIIPTCNRSQLLDRCLTNLARNVACDYEIIVIDGSSTDRTPDVLELACDLFEDRLTWIREDRRQGFVKAANLGFHAAQGRYLTWLSDDARPLPSAYDNAIEQLENRAVQTGLVAMYHHGPSNRHIAYEKFAEGTAFQLRHVRGTLYAGFAIAHRDVFEQLDYFDERYRFYAADTDFSLKAWHADLKVEPAIASFIDHDPQADGRRFADAEQEQRDYARLFEKWDLPPAKTHEDDFDPRHPCTLNPYRRRNPAA